MLIITLRPAPEPNIIYWSTRLPMWWPLKQQNWASLSKIEKDLIEAGGYTVRELR